MANLAPRRQQSPITLLGFDPLRLLLALRQWWWLVLGLPVGLAALGLVGGQLLSENRYTVSLQLSRLPASSALSTSTGGESFVPQQLSDDSLLATTYATEVLRRTAQRLDPPRSAGELKAQLEINKPRRSDFFFLTAHSRRGREDAVATVLAWAEEIKAFTRSLQQREAMDMRALLARQQEEIGQQLAEAEATIRRLAAEEQLVDEDLQLESTLAAVENLRLQRELARMEAEAKQAQAAQYRQEILAQNRTASDLRRKRDELAELLGRYTDSNPLVQQKRSEIARLEEQLQGETPAHEAPLTDYTGSDLGNQLYLSILGLESEARQKTSEVAEIDRLLTQRRAELAAFPDKRLRLSAARQRRSQLLEATELLASRWREATFFAEGAPSYLVVFQIPTIQEVSVSTKSDKALLLAAGGFALGLAAALLVAGLGEFFHTTTRTPWGALALTGAPLALHGYTGRLRQGRAWLPKAWRFLDEAEEDMRMALESYVLEQMAPAAGESRLIVVLASATVPGEESFWQTVGALASRSTTALRWVEVLPAGEPVLGDIGPTWSRTRLDAQVPPPAALPWRTPGTTVVRLHLLPHPAWWAALAAAHEKLVLVSPNHTPPAPLRRALQVVRTGLGEPTGTLLLEPLPERTVPRWLGQLEALWCRLPAKPTPSAAASTES